MILAVLGILDIIIGFLLVFGTSTFLAGSAIAGMFAFFVLLKGLYSIIAAAAGHFYFDVPGWIDLLAAVCLVLLYLGMQLELFLYIGAAMLLKGGYSFLMGIANF